VKGEKTHFLGKIRKPKNLAGSAYVFTYITAVVNEPCQIPIPSGVNDVIVIHPEEVAAPNTGWLIPPLSLISHCLSYHLTHILNDHLISSYVLHCKQPPVVDSRLGKPELLFPGLYVGNWRSTVSNTVLCVAIFVTNGQDLKINFQFSC